MAEPQVGKCNFCDMVLPKKQSNIVDETLEIDILRKYLPKITCGWVPELNQSCKECLEYIKNFHKICSTWQLNEKELKSTDKKLEKTVTKLKKNSSTTCRLCLNDTNAQESCFINNDFQRQYRKGYLQQIVALHAPFIDLHLTKDPVMCMTCLNAIQTFDAFYRMCEQIFSLRKRVVNLAEAKKTAGEAALSKDTTVESSVKNTEDLEKIVKANSVKIEPEASSNIIELMRQETNSKKLQEDDICVISDDDDVVIAQPAKEQKDKKTISTNPVVQKVRPLSTKNDSKDILDNDLVIAQHAKGQKRKKINPKNHVVKVSPLSTMTDTKDILDDNAKGQKRKKIICTNVVVKKVCSLSTKTDSKAIDSKKATSPSAIPIENSDTTPKLKEDVLARIPTMKNDPKEEDGYTIVEIDDSDSQDSDDELRIISNRVKKQKNEVKSKVIESPKIVQEAIISTNISHNTDQQIPNTSDEVSIEINMANVQKLFQTEDTPLECVVYNSNITSTEYTTDIVANGVEKPASPTLEKNELESSLSNFLQFKSTPTPTSFMQDDVEENLDSDATITPCFEINMTSLKKMLDGSDVADGNNMQESADKNGQDTKEESKNYPNPCAPQSFMSSFQEFLKGNHPKPRRGQVLNVAAINKKKVNLCDKSQTITDNNEIVISEDSYYICYPYKLNDSLIQGKKRKIEALVFEDKHKVRIYKCTVCLKYFTQESMLCEHHCSKYRPIRDVRHPTKPFKFKCDFCIYSSTSAQITKQHQVENHEKGSVLNVYSKCQYCFFESDDSEILKHHMLRRHSQHKKET